jgi:hypothetical protein
MSANHHEYEHDAPAIAAGSPRSLREAWVALAGLSAVFLFEMLDNSVRLTPSAYSSPHDQHPRRTPVVDQLDAKSFRAADRQSGGRVIEEHRGVSPDLPHYEQRARDRDGSP